MKKNIKFTKVKRDESLEGKTVELISKLEKFLKIKNEDGFRCEVELAKTTNHRKQGEIFRVEANLSVYGKMFRNEAEAPNLQTALDKCFQNLKEEVKKWKSKKITKNRKGSVQIKKAIKETLGEVDEDDDKEMF